MSPRHGRTQAEDRLPRNERRAARCGEKKLPLTEAGTLPKGNMAPEIRHTKEQQQQREKIRTGPAPGERDMQ